MFAVNYKVLIEGAMKGKRPPKCPKLQKETLNVSMMMIFDAKE